MSLEFGDVNELTNREGQHRISLQSFIGVTDTLVIEDPEGGSGHWMAAEQGSYIEGDVQ